MARKPTLIRRLFAPAIARGRKFSRDDRGVTAIEFAILGLPFFTIIFAMIETAMVFFAGQVLDSAVEDASRMLKTGQAQAAGYDIDDFRELVCSYTFNLVNCDLIFLRVAKIPNFAAATSPVPLVCDEDEETCDWAVEQAYAAGEGREVIQVFAYYRWPLLVKLPYFNLANAADGTRLLGSTRVFRNEPFQTAEPT
ncbi:MAG: pilus assembly protein [Hyphomicrobiales bacterium]|nr:MAG: pilus assembly protein [Hyphomicrobiales bacterium]